MIRGATRSAGDTRMLDETRSVFFSSVRVARGASALFSLRGGGGIKFQSEHIPSVVDVRLDRNLVFEDFEQKSTQMFYHVSDESIFEI